MKTLNEIKDEAQAKRTELFNKVGLFWAFSNEQFEEGKTPFEEGKEKIYSSIGHGGYLPKYNVDAFLNGMEAIRKEETRQIKESKKLVEDHIKYELANYESYYTGDISEACKVLPYPKKQILKIYVQERQRWAEAN